MKQARSLSRLFCIAVFFFSTLLGQGWQYLGTQGQLPIFYGLSAVNDSVCWFAGDNAVIVLAQTHSNSYYRSSYGLEPGTYSAICGRSKTLAYTASSNGKIFKTTNSGAIWTKQYTQPNGAFIDGIYFWTDSIGIAYGDPVAFPGTGQFVILRTTDGGTTWNDISSTSPSVTQEYGYNQTLDAVGTHVWFPTETGDETDSTIVRHLFHSRDQGLTWEKLSIPTHFGNFYVAFSDTSNGLISDVFHKTARTTDGGKTWSVNYNSVEGPSALKLQIQKGTSNVWAFGFYDLQTVNYHILYSSDFGSTWGSQTGNFPFYITAGFAISGSVVWAGGCNYLILRNTTPYIVTSVSTQTNQPSVPASFELSQNYPNPFNPMTTIKYHVQSSGSTKLIVYDILGRSIRTLVDGDQTAGWHMILWDGTNDSRQGVSTGTYFYRIENKGQAQTKKMLLLK